MSNQDYAIWLQLFLTALLCWTVWGLRIDVNRLRKRVKLLDEGVTNSFIRRKERTKGMTLVAPPEPAQTPPEPPAVPIEERPTQTETEMRRFIKIHGKRILPGKPRG
jgi:hypothetical protein